jgi:hypothetical protein
MSAPFTVKRAELNGRPFTLKLVFPPPTLRRSPGVVNAMFVISPPFTGMLATCFRLKDVASFAFSVWSSGASLLTYTDWLTEFMERLRFVCCSCPTSMLKRDVLVVCPADSEETTYSPGFRKGNRY